MNSPMFGRHCSALVAALLMIGPGTDVSAQRRGSPRALAIRSELAGVLLQSRQYNSAAREYRVLVALDPRNRSYRLGLARALAWGDRPREAERELVILAQQRPGDAAVEAMLTSVREALSPSAREAATWYAGRPNNAHRRILARALSREGRAEEALVHYDALLRERLTPELLVERAYVHMERRDFAMVEGDLRTSVAIRATSHAYILLGDLHRSLGDYRAARASYIRARSIGQNSPEVSEGFARLARDLRPAVAFMPEVNDYHGWQTTSSTTSDNLGARLTTMALRRGLRKPFGFDGSVGMKVLQLSDRTSIGVNDGTGGVTARRAGGYGADVAVSRDGAHRQLYVRGRARGGFVYHPSGDLIPDASAALAARISAWGVGGEVSTGPAYPTLFTLASFLPEANGGGQLRERTTALSIAGPLGRADIAFERRSTSFSDDNARSGVQAHARFRTDSAFALLYSGSALSFIEQSPRYWSPRRYVAHGVGVEYARRNARGFSFAARALPGFAWTTPWPGIDGDSTRTSALQFSGGAETGYRARHWEAGIGLTYGRGRDGGYERFDVVLHGRVLR